MQSESKDTELSKLALQTKIFLIGFIIGAALAIFFKKWLFPGVNEFAISAQCRTVFGIDGLTLLWYGVFAGIPLLTLLFAITTLGRTALKIFREKQYPVKNQKLFKPNKIFRGKQAIYFGFLHVLPVVLLLVCLIWGISQGNKASQTFKPHAGLCLMRPII